MRSGLSAASRTASAAVSPSVTLYPPPSSTRVSTQRVARVASTTSTLITGRSDMRHLGRRGVRLATRGGAFLVQDGQHQREHGSASDLALHRDFSTEQP